MYEMRASHMTEMKLPSSSTCACCAAHCSSRAQKSTVGLRDFCTCCYLPVCALQFLLQSPLHGNASRSIKDLHCQRQQALSVSSKLPEGVISVLVCGSLVAGFPRRWGFHSEDGGVKCNGLPFPFGFSAFDDSAVCSGDRHTSQHRN